MIRRRPTSSLSRRRQQQRAVQPSTASRRPAAAAPDLNRGLNRNLGSANHPLVDGAENGQLYQYETSVKKSFDAIVPALRKVSAYQHEEDFVARAQTVAMQELGFELPEEILQEAWVDQLDMRSLFAWCVFKSYQHFCDDFYGNAPLSNKSA